MDIVGFVFCFFIGFIFGFNIGHRKGDIDNSAGEIEAIQEATNAYGKAREAWEHARKAQLKISELLEDKKRLIEQNVNLSKKNLSS